ncbi:MAG: hypothetical protein COS84_09555 [Armatimonadetes bacterium CG07_land_8_20_14_0_80_40_9]|nr:MAG: hypothetical protein COS84_09555 [Armatimonadetes bacterium CG07_land_8_20_14_0_80_40_9]
MPEDREQRTEEGRQKKKKCQSVRVSECQTENRGQRTEVRWSMVDRSQETEDRRQKTEDRSQKP